MIKQLICIAVLFFYGTHTQAQKPKCKKFKTGTFIIPATDKIPESTLKRSKTSQLETISKDDFMVLDIEWIDDCNYVLKMNQEKTPVKRLTEIEKAIDDEGGLRIKMLRTVKDTMYFSATATLKGVDYPVEGYQIKISKDY